MPYDTQKGGYTAGHFALEMDSSPVGYIHSVEGGHATADVVAEKPGPDQIVHKHLAGVKYEDITVTCGTGMSKGFYDALKGVFQRNLVRRNGAVVTCDFNYKERSRLNFFNALITEVGFPALDASSKEPAQMTIKLSPERTQMQAGSGAGALPSKSAEKAWITSNFRLNINGLDCSRVNRVEAITVKQKVVENAVGESREYSSVPAQLDVPDLVITLPETGAQSFYDWHQRFVVEGHSGPEDEKSGTLDYLLPDRREVLFSLKFSNLGIFRLSTVGVENGSALIPLRAEMYCEDMSFSYGSGIGVDTVSQVGAAFVTTPQQQPIAVVGTPQPAFATLPSLRFRT